MAELPSGSVTFLFTDIEGSTRLVRQLRERYGEVLEDHQSLVRKAFAEHDGHETDTQGDAFFYAFGSAHEAVAAAVEGQRALAGFPWPDGASVRVRIGIHTGRAAPVNGRYTGLAVHRAARISAAGHGGQVLISQATQSMIEDDEEDLGVHLRDLGDQRLKDIDRPVRLYQVVAAGLPESFPPLREEKGPTELGERRPVPVYRRRLVVVIATAVALAIAAAALVLATQLGGDTPTSLASVAPDSLAVVDPTISKITAAVRIPGGPSLVAVGPRFVWVVSDSSRTISSISTDKRTVTQVVAPDATPSAIAADGDAVWVLDGSRRVLVRIDPASGAVTRGFELPRAPPSPATNRTTSFSVSVGEGALWVTDGSTRLLRIDPESGRVRALDVHEPLNDVAVGAGAVWAISGQAASVFQIDTQARAVKPRIRIVNQLGTVAPFPLAVAVGEGSVWVVNGNTETVTRIDPEVGGVAETIPLGIGRNPNDIAAGAGAVWVANGGNGTLVRVDPKTNKVATIAVGSSPRDVAVGDGKVWVTLQPEFRASISLPSSRVSSPGPSALPSSSCSGVEFPHSSQPRYLSASDLPFQDQSTLAGVLQMSDAIRFVLAQHHFRAGRYSIGYQSCDDSVPQTGSYDTGKCASNAVAYAANRRVIGVIGGFNSGCAATQIGVLGQARGGPLAMISPAATAVGLTHIGPGAAPGEPQKYYEHGTRNFVRVVATDDLQGAADALLAKRLGVTRLYLLHDGSTYGFGIASNVRHAATKLGMAVGGFEQWNSQATTYTPIARRIERTGAEAVFLGGSVAGSNGASLVRSLRSVLGGRVRILTPDGFTPISLFERLAGPAAEGATVSFPATPPERLLDEGQQFVTDFGKAIGRPVEAYSVAAAQAAEVLLNAIARSDGTRASVTKQLFKTKVSNGILGSFSIDRNGDTTAGAVTIYRIVGGSPRLIGVITPMRSLLH
jgi:YVTN family beta-propeller protein